MSRKIKGGFTVRFLRTGDQVYLTQEIVSFDSNDAEKGGSLFQAVDPDSGTLSVDWKNSPYDQPCVKVGAASAMGNPCTIVSAEWRYRNTVLQFAASPQTTGTLAGWRLSTDGKFARKEANGYCYLRVIDNLASITVVSNQQISYAVTYWCNDITDTINGNADVLIQQAGADSYSVNIVTSRCQLDAQNTSTILEARSLYGVHGITIDNTKYKLQWFKDYVEISGANGTTLTVNRSDVDGSSIYFVKLLAKDGSNNWVVKAQDSQRITDISDEWQIEAEVNGNSQDAVSKTHDAMYTLRLYRNGNLYTGSVSWKWTPYNALGVAGAEHTGASVTITKEMAVCVPDQSQPGKFYYADVDWIAEATISE